MEPEELEAKIGFAGAVIDPEQMLGAAIEWINDNLSPGTVYDREKLEAWARAAGFTKEEE